MVIYKLPLYYETPIVNDIVKQSDVKFTPRRKKLKYYQKSKRK